MTIRRSTAVALVLAASLAAGCGDSAPAPTDPSAAREFLTRALDAWKAGGPKTSLSGGSPSFLVNDPDWERAAKLVDYRLDGEGQPLGSGVQWAADLTLTAKGKTVEKKAVYVVNVAGDVVAVSRQDMDF